MRIFRFLLWAAIVALVFWAIPATALAQVTALPQVDVNPNVILVGTIMPPLIAAVVRSSWSPELKQLVSGLLCVVAAAGTAYLVGQLDLQHVTTSAIVVILIAEALYQKFYRPLSITDFIESGVPRLVAVTRKADEPAEHVDGEPAPAAGR